MKQKFTFVPLAIPLVALVVYLAGCVGSPLPVTAPTLTPASDENQADLPPTLPTVLPAASSTVSLPVVTVESTFTQPPAPQPASTTQPQRAGADTAVADAAAVAATAVDAAAVAQPALDPACLVGGWEVTNLAAALSSSQQQDGLVLDSVNGRAVYTFGEDGNLRLTYDQLSATLKGTVDGRNVTAVESVNGSALARYLVNASAQQIILSDFGGTGIHVQMEINGQRLAEGDLPAWQAFTSHASGGQQGPGLSNSRVAVTCAADRMLLRAVDPAPGPEVQLKRIQ